MATVYACTFFSNYQKSATSYLTLDIVYEANSYITVYTYY